MCFLVIPRTRLRRLIGAAQNVQSLLNDGTLAAAFGDRPEGNSPVLAATAFDVLAEQVAAIGEDQKEVSPFLRYRKEIMGNNPTAERLRDLLLNLYGDWLGLGKNLNLNTLFIDADEHHKRIALELIASYAHHGKNDPQFIALAGEVCDFERIEVL